MWRISDSSEPCNCIGGDSMCSVGIDPHGFTCIIGRRGGGRLVPILRDSNSTIDNNQKKLTHTYIYTG